MSQTARELAEQRLMLLEERSKRMARKDFLAFSMHVFPDWKPGKHHIIIAEKIQEWLQGKHRYMIVTAPPRHGKACAMNTVVPTTKGMKAHGDLKRGDLVFQPDGKPVRVVAKGPTVAMEYRVELTNGQIIVCHGEHEWTVYDRTGDHVWRTVETQRMARTKCWFGPMGKRGSRARYQIPMGSPLRLSEKKFTLHPYILGAWLGDGSSTPYQPWMTHAPAEIEVIARFEELGMNASCSRTHKTTGVKTTVFPALGPLLNQLGLWRNKHIPEPYQLGSIKQRSQLMAGLIDTDGHVCRKTGRVRFVNANKRLAEDVLRLARSLGARAYITEQQPATSSSGIVGKKVIYTVSFNPIIPIPCALPRKATQRLAKQRMVGIRSITPCEPEPGNCIQVDSPDGLYLVGEQLIPTHNSEQISRLAPAFAFGIKNQARVIAASYSATLASDFNRDVQRIITSERYKEVFPDIRLNEKNIRTTAHGSWLRNNDMFEIVETNMYYKCAGISGALTGRGGNCLIVDDPIKDWKSATSKVVLDSQWDWFRSVFLTRRSNDGGMAATVTRWSHDDLIGRFLRMMEEQGRMDEVLYMRLPAIQDRDPVWYDQRKPGEALWPEMFSLAMLEETRQMVGPRIFEALYQQNPTVLEGDIVKREWWKYYEPAELPDVFDFTCISCDLTFDDESRTSDFVVMQVWGKLGAERYLIDQVRDRMNFTRTLEILKTLYDKYNPNAVYVEKAANGAAVVTTLKRHMTGIIPVKVSKSKAMRLEAVAPQVQAGQVFIPARAKWVGTFVEEFCEFPSGAHDDQVDSLSLALIKLAGKKSMNGIRPGGDTQPSMWTIDDIAPSGLFG